MRNKEDIVTQFLKEHPEELAEFDKAYKKARLDFVSDDLMDADSHEAVAEVRQYAANADEKAAETVSRAAAELAAGTEMLFVTNGEIHTKQIPALPDGTNAVTKEEITALPEALRPQCTGSLMHCDCAEPAWPILLEMLKGAVTAKNEKQKRGYYGRFRSGLDLLDLDPVMYEMLGMNPASIGNWLPKVAPAAKRCGFLQIPDTAIAKVPLPLLQMSRLDYESLTDATRKIADEWAYRVFELDDTKDYFIKTGIFSSKFNFRNAHVTAGKEVHELGEYLLFIANQASEMAGPLTIPSTYGAATTNEWVVREWLPGPENGPTIYNGLPLRPEYRVFADFDTNEILGISPYWKPSVMEARFNDPHDSTSPEKIHDRVVFGASEENLMEQYDLHKDTVANAVKDILPESTLTGQWSVDVMQDEDTFWLIDMAPAENSALKECVPAGKLRHMTEHWLPELEAPDDKKGGKNA